MIRLTKPSLWWALHGILFKGNPIALWRVCFPWRWWFIWLYLNNEAYYLNKAEQELLGQNFKEPKGLLQLLRGLLSGEWLNQEGISFQEVKNWEGQPGRMWSSFLVVGMGDAKLPEIRTGESPKKIWARIQKWQRFFKATPESEADFRQRVSNEARFRQAVEEELKKGNR